MTTADRRMLGLCFVVFLGLSVLVLGAQAALVIRAPERVELGQPFFVDIVTARAGPSLSLTWLGRELTFSPDGGRRTARVLLGTDVKHVRPGVYEVAVRQGVTKVARTVTVGSRVYPEERLVVDRRMVYPSPTDLKRIRREGAVVGRVLRTVTQKGRYHVPFLQPVMGKVESVYGLRRFFNGQPRSPHRGLDFSAKQGESVKACESGRVTLVGDHFFAGRSVYVDHGLGVTSAYFHLSSVDVGEGQVLKRGQVIGTVGRTGRATGPHLHFGVYVLGLAVDPGPLLQGH